MRGDLVERLDTRARTEAAVRETGHNAADRERSELVALLREAAAALRAARDAPVVELVESVPDQGWWINGAYTEDAAAAVDHLIGQRVRIVPAGDEPQVLQGER